MSRRSVLSVCVTMVVLSTGLWTSPAYAARHVLLMRAFKGASGGQVLVNSEPFVSSWQPSGWSTCLVTEPFAPDLIDYSGSTPLPEAIASRSFVGCDRRLAAGKQTVDFTRRNSPHFDRVARRLTNGTDDMVWSSSFVVDDDLIPYAMSGGGCPESCPGWKQPAARTRQKQDAPDLRGFKVDLIRLRVREAKWRFEPEGEVFRLFFERSFVWEIHGRKR